ncbi:hypothetical protein [Streptomyces sp. NPDC055886]
MFFRLALGGEVAETGYLTTRDLDATVKLFGDHAFKPASRALQFPATEGRMLAICL